jgi:glucose/arabinose dehydrogenase
VLASYDSPAVTEINGTEFVYYTNTDLIKREGSTRVFSIHTKEYVGDIASLTELGYDPKRVQEVNATDLKSYAVEVFAENLSIPWDMVFLPNGDMLVTARTGTVRRLGSNPAVIDIPSVEHTGEGGLMGIVLHPEFEHNQLLYLYFTTEQDGSKNKIVRFRLSGNTLLQDKVILDNIPAAVYHDGGRLAFGPDGMLYATVGDATESDLAQDKNSLAGKTLRLTPDGGIPADNPFGTAVWSYGHRNAQGIAWDKFGRMWQTEHGRSGALSGFDELNRIEKGGNYGWPTIQGDETQSGMISPIRQSGADTTWAPAGLAYDNDRLFFAGLRGESLYEVAFDEIGEVRDIEAHFSGIYGRLRGVTLGPDGYLYVSTSNGDGRGTIGPGDDKILKIHPGLL